MIATQKGAVTTCKIDHEKAKQYLKFPEKKVSFNPELAKAFSLDDAIILSTLIRICHRHLLPGTVLDGDYYTASNAKQLHACFFDFWTWDHFINTFVPLCMAGLISFHHLPSPYLDDRSKQIVHYAPNYSNIYQALLWTKNK